MNRSILVCILLVVTTAALGAQGTSQSSPYEGTSNPPPDDQIYTSSTPQPKPPAAKPSAGHWVYVDPSAPAPDPNAAQPYPSQSPYPTTQSPYSTTQSPYPNTSSTPYPSTQSQPYSPEPAVTYPDAGTDDGIVQVAPRRQNPPSGQYLPSGQYPPSGQSQYPPPRQQYSTTRRYPSTSQYPADQYPPVDPTLKERVYAYDPDGDIVHPRERRRGELMEGSTIRVRLLRRLSTAYTEKGEDFRTRVATDVVQRGQVLIPAGSEIDGHVIQVSRGRVGGRGTMRLRPEEVILPDGSRYRLHAQTTGTPGSKTHVVGEGTIRPDSRLGRDGIEYGGGIGAGVITGAAVAGPVGAVTGGLIGAGVVTVHLLVSHPQANLETGTTLLFTLTEPLQMTPSYAAPPGYASSDQGLR